MERAPPALAADDHPPSPPPPPTPAPISLPGTPADYPAPAEHTSPQPDSPTPPNPPRPRRSARFRRDTDHTNDTDQQNTSDHSRDHSPSKASKLVTTDNDATHSPDDHQNSPNSNGTPNTDTEKVTENDIPDADNSQPDPESHHRSPDQHNPENEDTHPSQTGKAGDPTTDREDAPHVTEEPDEEENQMDTEDPDKGEAEPSDGDAPDDSAPDDSAPDDEPETSDTRETTKDTAAIEQAGKGTPDAADNPDKPSAANELNQADKPGAVVERDAADEANVADEPNAADHVMNDDDPSAKPSEREDREDDREAEPASEDVPSATADIGDGVEEAADEPRTETEASAVEKSAAGDDDVMDVDQPETRPGELEHERESVMEVDQPEEAREGQENLVEEPSSERVTDDSRKGKSVGDSPGDVTDSEDEIRPDAEQVPKPPSSPPSPPMTRRRLATRVSTPPESPPITTRSRAETPKTAPHKSSRRSSSSDDVIEVDKPISSRYETRSSARGSSPMRTRRRRHSEPAPVSEPEPKSRTRGKKKYSRKPVKGDRLRVMWHIDNIYYEGVVDSVLAFRGKRFYDITYDSGEREYYLELTHRKWRFADGRDGDDEGDDDDDDDLLQRDIDYSKYPQIGDRILVMWHVDGKYYPGKVNDILKANGAWFYDVNYEGGDREFFLDLTIRKWKYPEDPEEAGKHPLVDRKTPKSAPKPKPKPKAKPKPKRVARKSVGPGSSAFAGDATPPRSPPRPSRRNRTLQKLLDDDDGGIDQSSTQEDAETFRKKPSRVDEVLDELDRTPPTGQDKDDSPKDEANKPPESGTDQRAGEDKDEDMGSPGFDAIFENFERDFLRQKTSASQRENTAILDTAEEQQDSARAQRAENDQNEDTDGANFDVVFENLGNSTMDVLDEMRPPLSSQSVLKRPRSPAPAQTAQKTQEKEMDPVDMSDIFGDLLKKPALPLPASPSDPLPPSPPPRPRVLAERRTLAVRDRPLSPLKPQPAALSRPPQRPTSVPVQSLLKRKLAEQSSGAPLAKRQATKPKSIPKPTSAPQPRRLKTIEPTPTVPEKSREPTKSGDDPNVSEIVSVAGIVAKKWAREEAGRIASGIDQLKRHLSSLRTMHSKSLTRSRQKQRTAASDARILPDEEAEPQINTLGTSIVGLVRKYRGTVEEREKKLKNQFTRMRTKITEQNESLIETADVLSGLDIVGLEALNGLHPKVRKKLEVPPPLPPRQGSQAYTQPPGYALSTGVTRQPYQGPQGSPGSLGQQNDAVVRNLRRRLADLVTRSEWLGDEVKRLQGREKTLFREKTSALAELRKSKRATAIVDLTTNGRGRGTRAAGRPSLPAGKLAPQKPVGIAKRRTRASSFAPTAPSPSASKGSGKALRKTLPRSNSKYKVPPPEPQAPVEPTQSKGPEVQSVPPHASTAPPSVTPLSQPASTAQPGVIPPVSSTPAVDVSKARKVPSTLQVQMDKQASDLVSLTFTVWLLQDESRNEPPNGPGERMDTWVRGCVKKCLNSALTFLTASGGIFRARSNLKADVDNENIYTDWIMAAPTDDESIERARGNYSLWDPSLRDSEWQAEKRVLRGLNICYQKALSMTPAANYSATLMYAKAVLNKAISDFESFMPRTITVLPGKRSSPLPSRPQVAFAPAINTGTPIQPQLREVPQIPEKGRKQNKHTRRKVDGTEAIQNESKTQGGSMKPDNQASDLTVIAKSGQAPAKSADTVGSSTNPPTIPSSSAKSVEVTASASDAGTNAGGNVSKEPDGTSQMGQRTQIVTAPTAAAQVPSGSKPKEYSPSPQNQSTVAAADRTPSAAQPQPSAATQESIQPASTGSPQKEQAAEPTQEQTPSTRGTVGNVAQEKPVGGKSEENAVPSRSNQSSVGPAQTRTRSSQEHAPQKNSAQANQRQLQASTKSLEKPGKKSSGNAAQPKAPPRPSAKEGKPTASETPPASRAIVDANVNAAGTLSSTAQPAASRVRNVGASSPSVKGNSKTGRTTSRQPRTQTRSQKKGGSSGQAKGSRKQTQQAVQGAATSIAPSVVTSGGQAVLENSTSRLQEIPRKQIALSAARAPLELPRVDNVPSSGAQASNVGVTGTTGGPAQRTYPMLSRNQVRVTNALPSAPMLSRNQVVAGKRPQVGVAQMTVPAAPQRRVAPGMQSSGMYGPSHETDPMEIDAGRDVNSRRYDANPMGPEHHDMERGTGAVAGNDMIPPTQSHPRFPDDPENAAGIYTSSPPLNVLGRRQTPGTSFQQSMSQRQIGFKSLPQMALRQSSQSDVANDAANLPQLGMHGRVGQNQYEAQRATSGPLESTRTSDPHGSEYPYGQGTEPVCSPYNPAAQERDLHTDLMNPPTPSSFAGLDGYGISLGAEQVHLQRDSLPATPSDFDRYGIQSPINLERQNSRGTPQQQMQVHSQSQGQLGHIMNPQRHDGGGFSQPQRYQGRGTFPGRG